MHMRMEFRCLTRLLIVLSIACAISVVVLHNIADPPNPNQNRIQIYHRKFWEQVCDFNCSWGSLEQWLDLQVVVSL